MIESLPAGMVRPQEPGLDDFPTPPYATRALIKYVLPGLGVGSGKTIWEPACGRGHMTATLAEFGHYLFASDIHDYGSGEIFDFLDGGDYGHLLGRPQWIITNPPYTHRRAEKFASTALAIASEGVALFLPLTFLEGGRRYRLFSEHPPAIVAVFAERVPINLGRAGQKGQNDKAYCWLVWMSPWLRGRSIITWVPPSRRELERDLDYDQDWPVRKST